MKTQPTEWGKIFGNRISDKGLIFRICKDFLKVCKQLNSKMGKVSTDDWFKKMWYIYTMEYYSAIKRNEIESFVEMWMDLETVIQSEISQKEKNKYPILRHVCGT